MEKEEITTNDYLKGIVLNLPDLSVIGKYKNGQKRKDLHLIELFTIFGKYTYPLYEHKTSIRNPVRPLVDVRLQ